MKKKILVLFGAKSPEHEISVMTAQQVVSYLPQDTYEPVPVHISRDNRLFTMIDPVWFAKEKIDLTYDCDILSSRGDQIGYQDMPMLCDAAFLALHGPYGEDGSIQGMLELLGIPYTGSGVAASALAMDKVRYKKVLQQSDIRVPDYFEYTSASSLSDVIHPLPWFIKPSNQGSSVGMGIAKTTEDAERLIREALSYSEVVLIEEYIQGKELTCGVIEKDDTVIALPVVEIRPLKNVFFDYASKYEEGGAEEICPADISVALSKKVQEIATHVHFVVGCGGYSRTDFLVKNEQVYVLETNTLPGMTHTSLLPREAAAAGMSYPELLDTMISYALKK